MRRKVDQSGPAETEAAELPRWLLLLGGPAFHFEARRNGVAAGEFDGGGLGVRAGGTAQVEVGEFGVAQFLAAVQRRVLLHAPALRSRRVEVVEGGVGRQGEAVLGEEGLQGQLDCFLDGEGVAGEGDGDEGAGGGVRVDGVGGRQQVGVE